MQNSDYESFLESATAKQWKMLGLERRAGVNVPLFSIYSEKSTGIGEIPDLKILMDWCVQTGQSIIQLLPLNDVGFEFRPYDGQSTFALEPAYLSLDNLSCVKLSSWAQQINDLKKKFPSGGVSVNYQIKAAKLMLLKEIYDSCDEKIPSAFNEYRKKNAYWLKDYAFFRVLKNKFEQKPWFEWPEKYRSYQDEALAELFLECKREYFFYEWLQWQLYEQFKTVKKYGLDQGVYLMGDLPFLVSRDSVDVWAHQNYFRTDCESGAPPDAYISEGQRWGMPPYQWSNIAAEDYVYLKEKVMYAENFYSLFRIDHVVGLFRLWTIACEEPPENAGRNGRFDPENEDLWEEHGANLLRIMANAATMLPCAEDLGVVPECSYKVLNEMAIPGMEIQRWTRDWDGTGDFKTPEEYRSCAVTMISTHDMPHFLAWWLCEVGSLDENFFLDFCQRHSLNADELKPLIFNIPCKGRLKWKFGEVNRSQISEWIGNSDIAKELLEQYDHTYQEWSRYLKFLDLTEEKARNLDIVIFQALLKASQTKSIFSIQFIQDLLGLAGFFHDNAWETRLNMPGTVGGHNWSLVMPLSLEEMLELKENVKILEINRKGGRL